MANEVDISSLLAAKYIAFAWQEVANANPDDYLGSALFGTKKQMSLDMRWIKGASGLPVALKPSAWDAEIPLRGRINFKTTETEMPLFREGIQITERDRRALMEAAALGDAYVQDVLSRIFDDTNTLIRGAKVIPEIMIWQLLAPTDGKPKIEIADSGTNYSYNYDSEGTWYANNFVDGSANPWSVSVNAKPIDDLQKAVKAAKAKGVNPKYAVMSQKTMTELASSKQVRDAVLAQNVTANIYMTDDIAKNAIEGLTGVRPIVYNAVYADYTGSAKNFYPDGFTTIIPDGLLGNMVYGTTSEEYELRGDSNKNVSVVDNIAVSVVPTSDMPPRIATYASLIALPSYERMDEVMLLKVDADETNDNDDKNNGENESGGT